MNAIPLVTFHDLKPALQLRERLQAAGIEAEINDESTMEKYWFMSEPLAAVHLEVSEADYDTAAGMLKEMGKTEGLISGAVQCPECDSMRVEYPQFSRKFFTPRLGSVLLAMKLLPRAFYCLDCHYTWPAAEPIEPKVDMLGWRCDSKLWHPETQAGRRVPGK
jgi:hypothetical protein